MTAGLLLSLPLPPSSPAGSHVRLSQSSPAGLSGALFAGNSSSDDDSSSRIRGRQRNRLPLTHSLVPTHTASHGEERRCACHASRSDKSRSVCLFASLDRNAGWDPRSLSHKRTVYVCANGVCLCLNAKTHAKIASRRRHYRCRCCCCCCPAVAVAASLQFTFHACNNGNKRRREGDGRKETQEERQESLRLMTASLHRRPHTQPCCVEQKP